MYLVLGQTIVRQERLGVPLPSLQKSHLKPFTTFLLS